VLQYEPYVKYNSARARNRYRKFKETNKDVVLLPKSSATTSKYKL
jgi:hypothetical protein